MGKEVSFLISEAYLKNLWWIRNYSRGYKLNKIKQDKDGNPILNEEGKYMVLNSNNTKYDSVGSLIDTIAKMDLRQHEANTFEDFVENVENMRKCIEKIKNKTEL